VAEGDEAPGLTSAQFDGLLHFAFEDGNRLTFTASASPAAADPVWGVWSAEAGVVSARLLPGDPVVGEDLGLEVGAMRYPALVSSHGGFVVGALVSGDGNGSRLALLLVREAREAKLLLEAGQLIDVGEASPALLSEFEYRIKTRAGNENFNAKGEIALALDFDGSPDGIFLLTIPEPSTATNEPPDCGSATADPNGIWPPDHKFEDVSIGGVTDSDGDPVTITITGVAQDEPLEGLGDGNTCPDGGGVGTDISSLRAERSGPGDGRVYHVNFRADDGRGGECEGEVTVCVPHDKGRGSTCVDGGPIFDSTVCEGNLAAAASAAGFGRNCGIGFELAFLLPCTSSDLLGHSNRSLSEAKRKSARSPHDSGRFISW
jgi:hypothetical protein